MFSIDLTLLPNVVLFMSIFITFNIVLFYSINKRFELLKYFSCLILFILSFTLMNNGFNNILSYLMMFGYFGLIFYSGDIN